MMDLMRWILIGIHVLCSWIWILCALPLHAQTQYFTYTSGTGNNANIILPLTLAPNIDGEPLAQGDEIGIFTEDGLCVGAIVWTPHTVQSITIWGNNDQTPQKDGMDVGDSIYYRIWRQSTNTEYKNIQVAYDGSMPFWNTTGRYRIDAIYVLSSLETFPAPAPPELLTPDDDALHLPVSLEFQWEKTPRTDRYRFQLATDNSFSNIVLDEDTITTSSYLVDGLAYGTTYYWRVRGINLAGQGQWSAARQFRTLDTPVPPILRTPPDGAGELEPPILFVWEITERADRYRLQVGRDMGFTEIVADVADLTSTSFELSTPLGYSTEYFWRVSGINAAGQGKWSDIWRFTTMSRAIEIKNPTHYTVWQENSIKTIEWTSRGVERLRIEFTGNNGATWTIIEESFSAEQGTYQWTVPAVPSTQARVRLTDTANENTRAVSPVFSIYPRRLSLAHSVSFGDPSSVQSYRMIGLPGNNNRPISAFMEGKPGSDWIAFHDTGEDENYLIEYDGSATFNFVPGRAFWVLSRNGLTIERTEDAVPLSDSNTYTIPLHPGWNIISNPFEVPINWSDVQALNTINDPLWDYNGSFSQTNTFQPYSGYYYYNRDNRSSLSIPYPNGVSLSKPSAPPADPLHGVYLSIERDTAVLSHAKFAVLDLAVDNIEQYSIKAPPADFEEASIRIIHPENKKALHRHVEYLSDEGFEVHLRVSLPQERTYTLAVVPTKDLEDREMVLIQNRTGKRIAVSKSYRVNVSTSKGDEHYTLLIGTRNFVEEAASRYMPEAITLSQNYPNPFNPSTIIEYSIPENYRGAHAVLEIFNILGQRVRTLVHDYHTAGFYVVQWDARDDQGAAVPSGMYIYRLQVGGHVLSRTMHVIK